MAINTRRMAAIVIALKKKGLWREMTKVHKEALGIYRPISSGTLKKSLIRVHGKLLPVSISEELAKSSIAKVITPDLVQQSISKMPALHFSQVGIKNIYFLDEAGFKSGITSSTVFSRNLSDVEKAATLRALRKREGFGGAVVGVHRRGRILISAGGIEKIIDTRVGKELQRLRKSNASLPSAVEIERVRKSNYENLLSEVLLHETIHNLDNRVGDAALIKPGLSGAPDFLRAQGLGENWYRLSGGERSIAIEGFVTDYISYLGGDQRFKADMPEKYAVMKQVFEDYEARYYMIPSRFWRADR